MKMIKEFSDFPKDLNCSILYYDDPKNNIYKEFYLQIDIFSKDIKYVIKYGGISVLKTSNLLEAIETYNKY